MATGFVLDPTCLREDDITSPGPDAGDLAGRTVGFRVDSMWRAWDWVMEVWAEEFRRAGASVKSWRSDGRTGDEGERLDRSYKEFLASIDVAVVGLGNCGSCTGWTIRDALDAADHGLPTTAIVTANFVELGQALARRGGRSGLRLHVLPYPLNEQQKDDVVTIAREHIAGVVKTMGARLGSRSEAAE